MMSLFVTTSNISHGKTDRNLNGQPKIYSRTELIFWIKFTHTNFGSVTFTDLEPCPFMSLYNVICKRGHHMCHRDTLFIYICLDSSFNLRLVANNTELKVFLMSNIYGKIENGNGECVKETTTKPSKP